ncbi:MAG: hypothetical protein EBU46_17230 [Nitrosomonadaceae bacterium]|nr:hypothetical protein [Nitrosomonadaceae bacterium]
MLIKVLKMLEVNLLLPSSQLFKNQQKCLVVTRAQQLHNPSLVLTKNSSMAKFATRRLVIIVL